MDVTGNTSGTDNMLYGTKGTAANGTSVTGTIVATPVDDTLSTTSHNAIENAAVATALASKADSSAIPDSTSDLTNDSNFVSDSSYVHTDNNFTTTLKNKLDGIAAGATVDDHKWNDVTLTKSTGTTSNNIYVPYMTSTSGTGANLATASTTPTAHYIAKYDANKRLYSTTPTAGDDSTKVATTAFVQSAISALGSILNYKGTKSTVSNLPATGNTTGDVWIVTADSSEHVWNGSSWEQLGTTIDLSGYALASSVPDSTSDLTNDSGFLTSGDLPSWSQASTKPSYTASEVGAATAAHTHGNITNEGDITGNVAIANGDRLVINDESASKINNSSITFGTSTSTFLANNGTWQTPTDSTKVSKSGDTMTGILNLAGSGITFHNSSGDVGTRLYIDGTHLSGEEITSYDMTFTIPVSLDNLKAPISNTEATNKKYVDDTIASHYVTAGAKSSSTLGNYVTAEGYQTTASGNYAHAEGYYTTASGDYSHAEGYYTTASGNSSHAEGSQTLATHAMQRVFGRYNITDPSTNAATQRGTYIEIVGNGTDSNSRSNARTLDWSGNEVLAGKLTVGTGPTNNMDVATKQYVDGVIHSSTNVLPITAGGTGNANLGANSSGLTRAVVMNTSGTALTTRPLVDSTTHTAFSNTSTNLVTERAIWYGLPKINNDHTYDSLSNFYAPTSVGTANQILTSSGSGAPTWMTLPSGGFLSTNASGQLVGRGAAAWDIDNPPYAGVFNANTSSTAGLLPLATTHTGICMVLEYGNMANWVELYMVQRAGPAATGAATPRLFQRCCFSGTMSNWVEYTHS